MKTKFEQWEQEWRRVMPEVLKQQEERRSKIAPELRVIFAMTGFQDSVFMTEQTGKGRASPLLTGWGRTAY